MLSELDQTPVFRGKLLQAITQGFGLVIDMDLAGTSKERNCGGNGFVKTAVKCAEFFSGNGCLLGNFGVFKSFSNFLSATTDQLGAIRNQEFIKHRYSVRLECFQVCSVANIAHNNYNENAIRDSPSFAWYMAASALLINALAVRPSFG